MKNTIVRISLVFAVSILFVVALFTWSQKDIIKDHGFERKVINGICQGDSIRNNFSLKDIIKDHGFERKVITDRISLADAISLNKKAYYFAGHDEDTIYLGNYKAPTELIKITLPTLHTIYINIQLEKEDSIQPHKSYTVDVQPPYFYFMEGTVPFLKRGELNNWQPKRFMYDSTYFVSAVPMGKKRMALKSISRKTREYALALEQDNDPNIELRYDILEKQIDGVFCTDGQMLFNKELSKLIYIYYYRNQF